MTPKYVTFRFWQIGNVIWKNSELREMRRTTDVRLLNIISLVEVISLKTF